MVDACLMLDAGCFDARCCMLDAGMLDGLCSMADALVVDCLGLACSGPYAQQVRGGNAIARDTGSMDSTSA
jgi:hypothetical protein